MPDLEQQLTELSVAIAWPATPAVHVRVAVIPLHARRAGPAWRRSLAVAAAFVLVAAGLLAYTPTRDAIAGFLNLHTTVHHVQQLPSPSPRLGQSLDLGTPTTLAEAQTKVAWRIVVPSALGQPDQVYERIGAAGPSGGEITLVYSGRPDIKASGQTGVAVLITEARGTVNEQFFGKMIGPGTTLETVSVNGHSGWWISGQPHDFFYTDPNGNFQSETMRLATNTLILDDNGTIVRIEGDMSKQQALTIAASL